MCMAMAPNTLELLCISFISSCLRYLTAMAMAAYMQIKSAEQRPWGEVQIECIKFVSDFLVFFITKLVSVVILSFP